MTIVTRIDLKGLEKITKEMEPRAQAILSDAAFEVETNAKKNAPVKTGALRNSIHVNETRKDNKYSRVISDGVEYGIYQELGTIKMAAHPFLIPAVEAIREKFNKMWEALFK